VALNRVQEIRKNHGVEKLPLITYSDERHHLKKLDHAPKWFPWLTVNQIIAKLQYESSKFHDVDNGRRE